MKVLITGASGFIGQKLTSALLAQSSSLSLSSLILTDLTAPPIPTVPGQAVHVTCTPCDLTCAGQVLDLLLARDTSHIFLLHGLMSSGSEANFDLGLTVNFATNLALLQSIRSASPGAKVIFASSLAVFGGLVPSLRDVTEETMPTPASSYGMEKMLCEYLINDMSRRGYIDGLTLRFPTVVFRPGLPSAAASSFVSGIVREPLLGRRTTLPVGRELEVWICSVRTVVENLIRAATTVKLEGIRRQVNLPGVTVTVGDILDAMSKVGGAKRMELVDELKDESVERIVGSWPTHFDTSLAQQLGFKDDDGVETAIREFVQDERIVL
jgi:nucleoside-diphosphate-sugar epimerase